MKTIAIIINGIRLPYHVIHYAIEKAKKESCGIFALFLCGKHEPSKGYIFPSDITTTETKNAEREAAEQDKILLSDNMDIIEQMAKDEAIPYQSALRINASIEEVAQLTANADNIIVDEDFDKDALLCDEKISLKILRSKLNKPVDVVADKS